MWKHLFEITNVIYVGIQNYDWIVSKFLIRMNFCLATALNISYSCVTFILLCKVV